MIDEFLPYASWERLPAAGRWTKREYQRPNPTILLKMPGTDYRHGTGHG